MPDVEDTRVEKADHTKQRNVRRRRSGARKPVTQAEPRHAAASLNISAEAAESLPESYGHTDVKLLAVHPSLVHAYWEVTPCDLQAATKSAAPEATPLVSTLRFYDESVAPTPRSFDVEVKLEATNWYVPLGHPAQSYRAELGVKDQNGNFTVLARSNTVHTPAASPSANVDVRYALVGTSPPADNLHAKGSQAAQGRTQLPVNMTADVRGTLSKLYGEVSEEQRDFLLQSEINRPGLENPLIPSRQPVGEQTHAQVKERSTAKQAGVEPKEASGAEAQETANRVPEPVDMTEEVRRQLSGIYRHRIREERSREGKTSLEAPLRVFERADRKLDLAEIDERSFVSGVPSSRR